MSEIIEPLCYSVEEAAKALTISRSLAFRLVAEKKIPSIKLGRRLLVPKAQLEKMLEQGGIDTGN